MVLEQFFQSLWYQKKIRWWPLLPLAKLFSFLVTMRRVLYLKSFFTQHKVQVPVIVVGNITVGGTGKTPLVIHLVELLKKAGVSAGIISRGYKGQAKWPMFVNKISDPNVVGDEPKLLARRTKSPVVIGKKRKQAVDFLLSKHSVDVIILDDGLQHYALGRDLEIVVVDGKRGFGNGQCLPVGPLREPLSRLKSVDLVITNDGGIKNKEFSMKLHTNEVYQLIEPSKQVLLDDFKGKQVHAIAGIGNPNRFFSMLEQQGLLVIRHYFPDHHVYKEHELQFSDNVPIFMTEKDAVKCEKFNNRLFWCVPIEVVEAEQFDQAFLKKFNEVKSQFKKGEN